MASSSRQNVTRSGACGRGGAVAAARAQSVQAGIAMLETGGNAIDAAIAAAFVAGVVEPMETTLAGTGFPIDRHATAKALGFREPTRNSLDSVSDRDFALEFLSVAAICGTHLSRLAEEIVIWSTPQFGFVRLSDSFSTGSSIMPQKKNPDAAELVRAKAGRINGDLVALLTVMKGLPLTYSKDMQEDKEAVFDAAETLDLMLAAMLTSMLRTRISYRNWRLVHWLAYLSWPVAVVHGLATGGKDSSLGWVMTLNVTCAAVVLVALLWRMRMTGHPDTEARRMASMGGW